MLTMVKRLLRYLLERLEPTTQWDYPDLTLAEVRAMCRAKPKRASAVTRQQVIDLAREHGIILPSGGPHAPAPPPPEKQELVPYGQHRGRAFAADPHNNTLTKPKDLAEIVELLKALGHPFLMVAHREKDARGVHGWCNGSNWGRDVLEELARCAELNFKLEMEKCHGQNRHYEGEKSYSGRPEGEFLDARDAFSGKYLK